MNSSLLDMAPKMMELVLRLYLNRCDRKPLYWNYYDNGNGLIIKVTHKGRIKRVTFADLVNFFFAEERAYEEIMGIAEK